MDNTIEFQIKSVYADLRHSEKQVADFVLLYPKETENCSLVDLCSLTQVSQPTVIRFAKALGFDGYRSFREKLIKENMRKHISVFTSPYNCAIEKGDSLKDIPPKTIARLTHLLEDTLKNMSKNDFEKAVELIAAAELIDIYSVENSNSTAYDMLNKLLYLGVKARFFEDSYLQHICAGHLSHSCVAIGISYSGYSVNTVEALREAKKAGARTIAITNDNKSPILNYADVKLCVSNETSLIYEKTIFSRAPQLAIVDMIYMGLIVSDYGNYVKKLDLSGKLIKGRELKQQPEFL